MDSADSQGGSAASRSGLDRVARELRELQDDLARLSEHTSPDTEAGRSSVSSPAAAPSRARSAPSPFPAPDSPTETAADESAPAPAPKAEDPPARAAAPAQGPGAERDGDRRPPLAPPVSEVPQASQQLAKAIVDDAFAQAERILADAQLRTDELRGQIEHLVATRDRMQQAADRLIGEFERAISELRRPPRPPSTGV